MRLRLVSALLTGFTFSATLGCKYLCNLIGEDCDPHGDEDGYPSIVATSDPTSASESSTVETPTSTDSSTAAPTTDSTSTSTVTTSSTTETTDTTMESSDSTAISSSTTMPDPFCGDGNVDEVLGEICDDKANDGSYDSCTADCKGFGPYCGDGNVDAGKEDCDYTAADLDDDYDGCPKDCHGSHYIVFVTDKDVNGTMKSNDNDPTGFVGADKICNDEAAGKLSGSYMAWLSSSTVDASQRVGDMITKQGAAFHLINSDVVAADWDELVSGTLQRPISRTVNNAPVNRDVWTNTSTTGEKTSMTGSCLDWSSDDDGYNGKYGRSDDSGPFWTSKPLPTINCSTLNRLYCFQVAF